MQTNSTSLLKFYLVVSLAFFGIINANAQDSRTTTNAVRYSVPKVALIDIEGVTTISLSFRAPTEAGGAMTTTSNNSLWLNYSSTTATGQTNLITASISATQPGVNLRVSASSASSGGAGSKGSSSGTKTLTTSNQTIISNIGTCYTGNGTSRGHRLSYSLTVANYALIKHTASTNITVTYTITNN